MIKYFFNTIELIAFILPALPDKITTRLTILTIYFVAHIFKLQYYYAKIKKENRLTNKENYDKEIDNEKIQSKNKNSYISKIDGKIEPMFSFWSINSFEKLDRILNLNDGYKIMKFAEEIGFEYLSIKKEKKLEFFNINNQEDYNLFKNSY